MIMWNEIRPRFKRALAPASVIAILFYFGYHAIAGDHGLKAWLSFTAQKAKLSGEVALVQAERERLEHRVSLLKPETLDPDMLSEQARIILGYTHPDEVVIYGDGQLPTSRFRR
ncbi:MAG: septum formation initiator family protein [Sphingomonadales bacterium]